MSIKKRILSGVLAACIAGMTFGFSSCAGSWAFTRLVSNIGGKYIGGILFWILGGISMPVDMFILNVIEFWTGKKVVDAKTLEQTDENGNRLTAVKNDDGSLSLTVTEATGKTTEYLFTRDGDDFSMFDAEGVLLSSYNAATEKVVN